MLAGFWSLICEVRPIIQAGSERRLDCSCRSSCSWPALLVPVANSSGTVLKPLHPLKVQICFLLLWRFGFWFVFFGVLRCSILRAFDITFVSPCSFFSLLFKEHLWIHQLINWMCKAFELYISCQQDARSSALDPFSGWRVCMVLAERS